MILQPLQRLLSRWACASIAFATPLLAATFPGNARLESSTTDSTSALSWNAGTPTLTVACWFKISVPSDFTLTEDMALLVNNRTSNANNHAYAIYLSASTANIEFTSRGAGGIDTPIKLIQHPAIERWYHLSVVRSGSNLTVYVDGRESITTTTISGNANTTDGISIGGWGNAKYFRGEIQEVAIYQRALTRSQNFTNMLNDVALTFTGLRGYYKLPYSPVPADNLKNFVATPASGTEALLKQGTGAVEFPETDKQGEQSLFDSRKNNGFDAASSLSGSFSWSNDVLSRATPGIPFNFSFGYNSGIAFNGQALEGGLDVYSEDSVMGRGWRHSYQMRLIPGSQYLAQGNAFVGLLTEGGSIETWKRNLDASYLTTHGEYRGEMRDVENGAYVEWTTPDRVINRFYHPTNWPDSTLAGRLVHTKDFNGNTESFAYDVSDGRLTTVTDTGGGIWRFVYDGSDRLSEVSGPSPAAEARWTVTFTYKTITVAGSPVTVLWKKSLTASAGYPLPVIDRLNLSPTGSTLWEFSYDTQGLLNGIISPRYQGQSTHDIRVTYDTFGRKITEEDAENRQTTFKYNIPALRQLTTTEHFSGTISNPLADRVLVQTFDRKLRQLSQKDPMGFITRYEYDVAGNVTAITDPRGARTVLTYDTRSNILSRTNALGDMTTWAYGHVLTGGVALNKPTKETRPATAEAPAGWENRYTYDSAGNLLTHSDDIGSLATHAYDTRGLVVSSKDANLNETTFGYDATTGFLVSRTAAFGTPQAATWNFTHTELGWPKTETNPLGHASILSYNINGQVVATTDAIGRTFTKAYDGNGNLVAESDGKGVNTTYHYNRVNELIDKYQRPLGGSTGSRWRSFYNPFGEVETVTSPSAVSDGNDTPLTSTNLYDLNGRLIEQRDPYYNAGNPALHRVLSEYDANGNLIATIDKTGNRWEKSYDALNRPFAERDPEGNVSRTSYDAAGRVLVFTSPNGFPTTHEYDGRGRLRKWQDPEGFEWTYTYDGVGNILDIEDALHGHYEMTYGPRNERLTERNQDNKQWTYTYDALLRLATQMNPPGSGAGPGGGPVTRALHYDPVGRLESAEFNTGRINSLGYDDNNNVRFATRTRPGQPTTTLQLDYDAMDRLVETRDTFSKTVRYGYDSLGRIVTKGYPGGKSLTHGYDKLGRLTSLAFTGVAQPCTFSYDDAGRLTGRSYPNGVTQANAFDDAGRVTSLGYAGTASPQVALSYAYDRNGNKTGGGESGTLAWKDADLTAYDETATFTPGGKLIARNDGLSARDFAYAYDDAGNLKTATAANGESYDLSYDEDNRTTAITWDSGTTEKQITNRYDVLGRRVARTLDTAETRYVLDLAGGMERILCDTTSNGNITAWYIHGPDLCFKVADSGAITCYHADAQGNVIRTTNTTGATINQYAYTPYGRAIDPTPSAITDPTDPYRFVGSQGVMLEFPESSISPPGLPSSNLYFMRARYYSADAAVFFAIDPVKTIGPGLHIGIYNYGDGNPSTSSDPSGLLTEEGRKRIQRAITLSQAQNAEVFAQLDSDLWNIEANYLQAVDDSLGSLRGIATGDVIDTTIGLGKQISGVLTSFGVGDGELARRGIGAIEGVTIFSRPFMDAEKAVRQFGHLERSSATLVSKAQAGGSGAALKFLNTSKSQFANGLASPVKKIVDAGFKRAGTAIGNKINDARSGGSGSSGSNKTASNGAVDAGRYAGPINFTNQKTANSTAPTINKPKTPKASNGGLIGRVRNFFRRIFN